MAYTSFPIPTQKLPEVTKVSSAALSDTVVVITTDGVRRIEKGQIGFARLFVQSSQPTGQTSQDIWIDTGNGNSIKVWDGSSWSPRNFSQGSGNVPLSALEDIGEDRVLGRISSGDGGVEQLTPTQLRSLLNVADGANNYSHPNHTGDVTSSGDGAQTIAEDAVDNTKAANMPANTIKGNPTGASADPQDMSPSAARTLLNVEEIPNSAAQSLRGNPTGSPANPTDVEVGANEFPARASTGNLEGKSITDFILGLTSQADAPNARAYLGILGSSAVAEVEGNTLVVTTDDNGQYIRRATQVTEINTSMQDVTQQSGGYVLLHEPDSGDSWAFWLSVNGTPASLPGGTADNYVELAFGGSFTNQEYADALHAAINGQVPFNSTINGLVITVTNAERGKATNGSQSGLAQATVNTTTEGGESEINLVTGLTEDGIYALISDHDGGEVGGFYFTGDINDPGRVLLTPDQMAVMFARSATTGSIHTSQDKIERTAVNDANYNVEAGDHLIAFTALTAQRTALLPFIGYLRPNQEFIIKDESGDAGTHNIVVGTDGNRTIDGSSAITIDVDYGVARVYFNGTNYFTI